MNWCVFSCVRIEWSACTILKIIAHFACLETIRCPCSTQAKSTPRRDRLAEIEHKWTALLESLTEKMVKMQSDLHRARADARCSYSFITLCIVPSESLSSLTPGFVLHCTLCTLSSSALAACARLSARRLHSTWCGIHGRCTALVAASSRRHQHLAPTPEARCQRRSPSGADRLATFCCAHCSFCQWCAHFGTKPCRLLISKHGRPSTARRQHCE